MHRVFKLAWQQRLGISKKVTAVSRCLVLSSSASRLVVHQASCALLHLMAEYWLSSSKISVQPARCLHLIADHTVDCWKYCDDSLLVEVCCVRFRFFWYECAFAILRPSLSCFHRVVDLRNPLAEDVSDPADHSSGPAAELFACLRACLTSWVVIERRLGDAGFGGKKWFTTYSSSVDLPPGFSTSAVHDFWVSRYLSLFICDEDKRPPG